MVCVREGAGGIGVMRAAKGSENGVCKLQIKDFSAGICEVILRIECPSMMPMKTGKELFKHRSSPRTQLRPFELIAPV